MDKWMEEALKEGLNIFETPPKENTIGPQKRSLSPHENALGTPPKKDTKKE